MPGRWALVALPAPALYLVFAAQLYSLSFPSDIALKVKVTDAAGASIRRALIQVRTSESRIEAETRTDAQGEAVLYLDSDASTMLSKRARLRILEKRG